MQGIGFYAIVIGFAVGIACASLYGFSWLGAGFVLVLCALFGAGYLAVRRAAYLVVFAVLLAFLAGGFRTSIVPTELPAAFVPLLDQRISLEGTVVDYPDARETSVRLTVETQKDGESTRIIAVAPAHKRFQVGDRVSVSGTLALPEPFEADGGRTFAYDAFLAKDGVFAIVSPARVEITGRDNSASFQVMRVLGSGRDAFMRAVGRSIPEPESALAAGLIVGGKQGLGEELLDDFTTAGLIHIVVLSGYNVTIVAEAILRGLGFLPRRIALTAAASSIGLFVIAAGAGSAAWRAGAMALLGLIARTTGRTYAVVRALFATLAGMLLWNPLLLIHDPGFQFSFVATLGLILLGGPMERFFYWIKAAFIREVAASTFAAQVGVLPLLLFHTGNLSLVSFGVNVLVLPVIPIAMGLAAAASFVGLILPAFADALVITAGLPAYAFLAYVIGMARFAASLPLAQVVIPAFPFWVVVVAYALLGWVVWKLRKV